MIAIDLCKNPKKTQKVWAEMTKGGCDEGHHEEAMMKVCFTIVVGVFALLRSPVGTAREDATVGG